MNFTEKVSHEAGWDANQLDVIQAPPDARLVVEAGPGTGKTAVACARLSYLISERSLSGHSGLAQLRLPVCV
jgi:superfamily I DNA/RNA helicase